jgi:hypothetical protein
MNDDLERTGKEAFIAYLMYFPGFYLEEENHDKPVQDFLCTDQDSNRASPEYEPKCYSYTNLFNPREPQMAMTCFFYYITVSVV